MRLCIATQSLGVYSETFIQGHIAHLPFEVHTLSGSALDSGDDKWLLAKSRSKRATDFLRKKFGHYDHDAYLRRRQVKWLRENRIGAVLAEYGMAGVHILAACNEADLPLIVHFHGFDVHNREVVDPLRKSYAEMFAAAAAIIGVSTVMCEHLAAKLGAPREKIHHIPYFVDPNLFTAAAPASAPPTLLAVGRFVEKKAPHLTLLSFAEALKSVPGARLEMAGDGPLLGPCQWLARALGIAGQVDFHGVKEHTWVAKKMQESRAFVQHSVTATNGDSEGTPVAILEAQCCGLPVIATRHTGIADVVVDGETGFLCDEGDIHAMAEKMVQILTMPANKSERMSSAARSRIETHFGRRGTIDRLAEVIRQAVS